MYNITKRFYNSVHVSGASRLLKTNDYRPSAGVKTNDDRRGSRFRGPPLNTVDKVHHRVATQITTSDC